jgi:cobyrinic acid a,c-diamide synthase
MQSSIRGFVIAAPTSGSGKTTLTMGILAALCADGLHVQAFKVGPDYIDTAFHSRVTGRPAINLDTWMGSPEFARSSFQRHCQDANIAVIEGVMGLFDGHRGDSEIGSSAHLAKLLGLPVLLVIDAHTCSRTAGAIVLGCQQFDPNLNFVGVMFNRVAGDNHYETLKAATESCCDIPVLGGLPKDPEIALPERQLGLVSVHEQGLAPDYLAKLTSHITGHISLKQLLSKCPSLPIPSPAPVTQTQSSVRIGIAQDEAFCFYYEDNLRLLREAGADLVPFSPLRDNDLPPNLKGLYLGGGFPEKSILNLADNRAMLQAVKRFKGPVLAECGGLLYLCKAFRNLKGQSIPMAGRINGTIRMTTRLQSCAYTEITTKRTSCLGPPGTTLRGHRFHWSKWEETPRAYWGVFDTATHAFGYADDNTVASYFHCYFGSNPQVPINFIKGASSS